DLIPGAVVAGVAWAILQALGGYIVGHQLKGASQTYGVFAVVIGLLSWLYLQAQITLLAAEVNVVLVRKLWPRSLSGKTAAEADDDDCRVVVLAGEGRHFSAGADLRDPEGRMPSTWSGRRRAAGAWPRLLDDLEALPQPTVARLHGAVVGGAGLIAVACDFRVAAPDLAFSIPEVALGIPLTWAGIPRLVREIGLPRAREVVMTGRVVGADDALAWGLVHH